MKREKSPNRTRDPVIVFTGNRHNERFEIRVNRVIVELRHSELLNLIKLIVARADSEVGMLPLHRRDVHRLRAALDAKLGRRFGTQLIQRGDGPEYCVGILRDRLGVQVETEKPFRELAGRRAVPKALIKTLSRISGRRDARETLKRPKKS